MDRHEKGGKHTGSTETGGRGLLVSINTVCKEKKKVVRMDLNLQPKLNDLIWTQNQIWMDLQNILEGLWTQRSESPLQDSYSPAPIQTLALLRSLARHFFFLHSKVSKIISLSGFRNSQFTL